MARKATTGGDIPPVTPPAPPASKPPVAHDAAIAALLHRQQCREDLTTWSIHAMRDTGQTPARHHLLMIDALERLTRGEFDRLLITMPPGHAKALVLDTPIATPTGWTTMGDLKVGDQVFDEHGQPCNVIRKSPVWKDRPVYAVRTDCGDTIIADEDHEWRVMGHVALLRTFEMVGERSEIERYDDHPNTFVEVKPAARADTVCIEVDSQSHLFLAGYSMTPTHNSTYASLLFPAWFLAQQPNLKVIGASHTQSLAEDISLKVRSLVADNAKVLGFDLNPDSRSRERWKITNGGEYLSASTGKKIAGARANLLVIDDPIGSRAEAESKIEREALLSWFYVDAMTRLLPGGKVVLMHTRWSTEDLAGRLLQQDAASWHVINLPAIAEEDDALGRAPGEALWPEFYSLEMLERTRAGMALRDWLALYQQQPRPAEGLLFRPAMIGLDESDPPGKSVRCWDIAGSTNTRHDYTAGVLLVRRTDGRFHIQDVVRERLEPEDVERLIVATAARDGVGTSIVLPQDPGAAGKFQARYLSRALAGYTVEAVVNSGDKATRAGPIASQINIGNVTMAPGAWNRALLEEMEVFPAGKHDDMVDALAGAFSKLLDKQARPARLCNFQWMSR